MCGCMYKGRLTNLEPVDHNSPNNRAVTANRSESWVMRLKSHMDFSQEVDPDQQPDAR